MDFKSKMLRVASPLCAVALACAMAPAAFAAQGEVAQGDAGLQMASVVAVQDDAKDISDATITVAEQTYTGSALKPAVKVEMGDKVLTAGTDYDVDYANNVNAGTATATITGKGDYEGRVVYTFKINPAPASKFVVASISSKVYSGDAFKPTPAVTFNGKKLANGTDYTLSYANNKNAGKAQVVVKGKGNFAGTKNASFKIEKASFDKVKIDAISNKTYTGNAITVSPKATYKGKKLKQGTDFTTVYHRNVNVGTAEVVLKGATNFKGKKDKNFKILPANIGKAAMGNVGPYTYSGSAFQPSPAIKFNGKTLKKGSDYTLSYKSNVNAGTAQIIATGKKNFKGTKKGTFRINPAPMSAVSIASIASRAYTGSPIQANPQITYKGKTLKNGSDYTLSYNNNVNIGTANVTITGKGNFTGQRTTQFSIVQKNLAVNPKGKIAKIAKQKYTGQPICPTPTVTVGGRTLAKDVDYTLSYQNNTEIGKATVVVTGRGNYSGQIQRNFKIGK